MRGVRLGVRLGTLSLRTLQGDFIPLTPFSRPFHGRVGDYERTLTCKAIILFLRKENFHYFFTLHYYLLLAVNSIVDGKMPPIFTLKSMA